MGLDMYVEKFTRPTDAEMDEFKGKSIDTIKRNDAFVWFNLSQDEQNGEDGLTRALLPYMRKIQRTEKYWDTKKIEKEQGIPEDAKVIKVIDGIQIHYRDEHGKEYVIDFYAIRNEGKEKQYIVSRKETYGIVKREEVCYWRKNYSLKSKIHSHWSKTHNGEEIHNCEYCPLDDGLREIIRKDREGRYKDADLDSTDDSIVCYMEWY